MGLVSKFVTGLFGKSAPIETRADLGGFMDSRAAFLAQKCVVEFCRVRAGANWQKLFSEAEFQRELHKSRWRAYPPAFAMVAEMVEGNLREAAGLRQRRLPSALDAVTLEVFGRYEIPPEEGSDFWDLAAALVRERLGSDSVRPAQADQRDAEADGPQGLRRAAAAQGRRDQ